MDWGVPYAEYGFFGWDIGISVFYAVVIRASLCYSFFVSLWDRVELDGQILPSD